MHVSEGASLWHRLLQLTGQAACRSHEGSLKLSTLKKAHLIRSKGSLFLSALNRATCRPPDAGITLRWSRACTTCPSGGTARATFWAC